MSSQQGSFVSAFRVHEQRHAMHGSVFVRSTEGLLQEDAKHGTVQMRPITTVPVVDVKQGAKRLRQALHLRTISATDINEHSSRAHTIFQLHLDISSRGGAGGKRHSTLTFVDLAGSERLSKSNAEGIHAYASHMQAKCWLLHQEG